MTADQWYIAIALVLVIVIIAYFAMRKRGDTTTHENLICSIENPCPPKCPQGQIRVGGKCVTPLGYPTGASCTEPWDCTSMACARQTAEKGAPYVCCAKSSEMYAGYEYCQGMVPGSTCWSDDMCASGDCKGNENGLRKGTCA